MKAERARRSFYEFVKQAWCIVEPAMPFVDNFHVEALCIHLEAVTRGEITRLLINIPPGHAKSLIVSVLWPAWVWTRDPQWRALFASYALDLAIRDSARCRTLIESAWYRLNFSGTYAGGAWELSGDQNVKSYYANTASGFRMALSVGSKATGYRGNCVAVDDPLNVKEAPSKLVREEAIYWWDKVMSSRLNDMRTGSRVIVMQRVHEDDPAGHVLARGGYEHLCIPSLFDARRRSITFANVKKHRDGCTGTAGETTIRTINEETGAEETLRVNLACTCPIERRELWRDPRTEDGELLFPELFPAEVLAQAKIDLGSDGFAGQHQQRPAPEDGDKFRKAWWRFWKPDGKAPDNCPRPSGCYTGAAVPLPTLDRIIISLDAAFKDLKTSDYVVFQVWGCNRANRYLLDVIRGKMSFTATIAAFRFLCEKWPTARKKIVEDKANGTAVIDTLKSEIPGIVAVEPEGGKEARAAAVQPQVESGNVYLLDGAAWLDEFVAEFAAFPNGKNDDQVDALSQALRELTTGAGASRAKGLANL